MHRIEFLRLVSMKADVHFMDEVELLMKVAALVY